MKEARLQEINEKEINKNTRIEKLSIRKGNIDEYRFDLKKIFELKSL